MRYLADQQSLALPLDSSAVSCTSCHNASWFQLVRTQALAGFQAYLGNSLSQQHGQVVAWVDDIRQA